MKRLSKKQQGFVRDFIKTGNATQAALNNYEIESEDKENVAGAIGSENLTKPMIQAEIKPALERYKKELDEILSAMELKDKHSEQYKTLVDAASVIQKQIQLLSGGITENVGVYELTETLNTWINSKK